MFTVAQFANITKPHPATQTALTLGCAIMTMGTLALAIEIWKIANDPYSLLMFGMAASAALLITIQTAIMATRGVASWSRQHANKKVHDTPD